MFLRRRSCVFFSRSYAAKVISHEQSSIFANVWQFRSSAAALFGKSRNNWAIKRRRKIGCSPKRFLSVSSFPQSIPDPHFCVYELPFFSSRRGYLPGSFSFFNKVGPVGVGILINPRPCHFEPRVINQNLFSFLGGGRPFTPTRLMKKHNGISRKVCFFFFKNAFFKSFADGRSTA